MSVLRSMRPLPKTAIGMVAAMLLFVTTLSVVQAQVPTPTVTGPIPSLDPPGKPSHDYPQMASAPMYDLSRLGYIEEEFFFSGTARSYSTPTLADGIVVSSGHPYKSRLIVRRPVDSSKFNGVVIVEWVNVTSGYNLDLHWEISRDYLTRAGYAYVGVSAQRVGVQQAPYGLTVWSPTRYGTLDVTGGGVITNDSLSYDIFSQAGKALQDPNGAGVDMLGGLRPQLLIAVGASQSAQRLTPYYNSIHPLHRVYDGFFASILGGPFRTDLGTKLIRVNTEREIVSGEAARRQPDSDIFRSWEIAGASHVDYWLMMYRLQLVARDALAPFDLNCNRPPLSHVNNKYVLNAAYDHLVRWIKEGTAPPVADPILVTSISPLVIPRDSNGLVFGGIRLASVEVPIATNTGANGSSSFCILYGSHEPFDRAKLDALYPNHNLYVFRVAQATKKNLNDRFILVDDANEIFNDAQVSLVGTPHPLPIP